MQKTGTKSPENSFSKTLLRWNREANSRQMPWKGEKDPYKIWLSEIILQQTRVEQGLGYYERFVKAFPDINRLAKAPDTAVFKLWEGLGYYSRCRNLLTTARYISQERAGQFPNIYEEIVELKGIGPYTAAAISSFAFNLPHAVVDGNVFRVLARIFGIDIPIDSTSGKKHFTELANRLLDKKEPAAYNQAIMDFGAMVCKPQLPLCNSCVFNKNCAAYQQDRVAQLPVKEKKTSIRKRWFYYLVFENHGRMAISQRTEKDIWNQLYEFPVIETNAAEDIEHVLREAEKRQWMRKGKFEVISVSALFKQQLSHQLIAGQFIHIRINESGKLNQNTIWVTRREIEQYAFPKLIIEHLKKKAHDTVLF